MSINEVNAQSPEQPPPTAPAAATEQWDWSIPQNQEWLCTVEAHDFIVENSADPQLQQIMATMVAK